jgi:hypothetical protein
MLLVGGSHIEKAAPGALTGTIVINWSMHLPYTCRVFTLINTIG